MADVLCVLIDGVQQKLNTSLASESCGDAAGEAPSASECARVPAGDANEPKPD